VLNNQAALLPNVGTFYAPGSATPPMGFLSG